MTVNGMASSARRKAVVLVMILLQTPAAVLSPLLVVVNRTGGTGNRSPVGVHQLDHLPSSQQITIRDEILLIFQQIRHRAARQPTSV